MASFEIFVERKEEYFREVEFYSFILCTSKSTMRRFGQVFNMIEVRERVNMMGAKDRRGDMYVGFE